ncbi:MAG: hypothetical protein ACRD3L_12740 [Terriglobales bacterium]
MSVIGISPSSSLQLQTPMIQPTRRQSEDQIGRQMEQALQNGDLNGAEQAYQQLAAFGPNNSGPFKDPTLQAEFQALGQDLQNGDLSAAQSDNNTLTTGVLKHDVQAIMKEAKSGNAQAMNNAMANLQGDYWAVYGQQLSSTWLQSMENGSGAAGNTTGATGVNNGSTVGGGGSPVNTTGISFQA